VGEMNLDRTWNNYFIIGIADSTTLEWKFIEVDVDYIDPIMEGIAKLTNDDVCFDVITAINTAVTHEGKTIPYKSSDNVEYNLSRHFEKYTYSWQQKEISEAIKYLHPNIFKYIAANEPSLTNDQIKEIFINHFTQLADRFKEDEYGFQIDDVLQRHKYGSDVIIKLKYSIVCDMENIYQSFGSYLIAISHDNGATWVFVEYDPETVSYILSDYPHHLIQKILSDET
jgi:hypothetical protein